MESHQNQTMFFDAVFKGDTQLATQILHDSHLDINVTNSRGKTALHVAVETRNLDMSAFLIENGAHVDAMSKGGYTVLFHGIESRSTEIVRLLLKCNPDKNHKANKEAAKNAILYLFLPIIGDLMENGFVPIPNDPELRMLDAVRRGDLAQLKCCLNKIGPLKRELPLDEPQRLRAKYLEIGLFNAVECHQLEATEELIKHGADVYTKDWSGCSLSKRALQLEDDNMLWLIWRNQNSLMGFEAPEDLALVLAIESKLPHKVKRYLECGAKVNGMGFRIVLGMPEPMNRNDLYEYVGSPSPLHLAVHVGSVDIAKQLIMNGAKVNNVANLLKITPLMVACSQSSCTLDMLNLLLCNRAKVNRRMGGLSRSSSLLKCVSKVDDERIAQALLTFGADVNCIGHDSVSCNSDLVKTPLSIAVARGRIETVKLLVNYGANVSFFYNKALIREFSTNCENLLKNRSICKAILKNRAVALYAADIFRGDISRVVDDICHQDLYRRCLQEVMCMKNDMLDRDVSVSVLDIVKMSVSQLVPLLKNARLCESLSAVCYGTKYHCYDEMIWWKWKLAEKRLLLEASCLEFLRYICPNFPIVCSDLVESYLSNTDKKMLICVFDPSDLYITRSY